MGDLKSRVVEYARECGFDLVRVTGAEEFDCDREAALERISNGQMDGLPWFTQARVKRGTNPRELLSGARSIICLGLSYLHHEDTWDGDLDATPGAGKLARYAWVKDYHRAMKRRMREFVRGVEGRLHTPISARWYVDDGPMLDRAAAARAGLGWFGKSTNILTSSHGSWIFLGQIITDLDLEADTALKKTCGACVRCIDACPTGAIVAPYVVDNTRCISYLTIENRGGIPTDLRSLVGNLVFGCDICQDVCPVNRKANSPASPIELAPALVTGTAGAVGLLDLIALLEMTEPEFKDRFQGTSVMRAKHSGMQRNACVALGNLGQAQAVPALSRALREASDVVRGHAAWALGRIGTPQALEALENAQAVEVDHGVLSEIGEALAETGATA